MSGVTHPADSEDLSWVWPAAAAAHLFADGSDLAQEWESAPWRVRVTSRGEAAILGPWRAHLSIMAIRGLWCSSSRVPVLLEDLRAVARQQGFERIFSPLVPKEHAAPYERAGLERAQEIVVYRLDRLDRSPAATVAGQAPPGVHLTVGTVADLRAVRAIDSQAFDDFWRYDERMLQRYMVSDRLGLAYRNGRVVGYTLSTLTGSEATLGRLAVAPGEQGCGIGTALLSEAVAAAARDGARGMTLCTQLENEASRRLYRKARFHEAPGHLVGLLSGPL
jgi:ribosomal protein S18 acetylase RimI-like enzyme